MKPKSITIQDRLAQFVKPKYRVEIDLEKGTERKKYQGPNRQSRSKSESSQTRSTPEGIEKIPDSPNVNTVSVQDVEQCIARPDTPNSATSQTPLLSSSPSRSPVRSPIRLPLRQSTSSAIYPVEQHIDQIYSATPTENTVFGSNQSIIKTAKMNGEEDVSHLGFIPSTNSFDEHHDHIKTFLPESSILSILSICCYCLLPTSLLSLYFSAKIQELVIQGNRIVI
jgi:hypothetical protein